MQIYEFTRMFNATADMSNKKNAKVLNSDLSITFPESPFPKRYRRYFCILSK